MTASALPPLMPDPDAEREARREQDRTNRRRLFRHVVMGYLVGTAIGVVGYVLILLVVGPERVKVPWVYTVLALYQAGMIGGFVGVAVFMQRKSRERDGDDDDQPGGGLRAPVVEDVEVRVRQRARKRSWRPVPALG